MDAQVSHAGSLVPSLVHVEPKPEYVPGLNPAPPIKKARFIEDAISPEVLEVHVSPQGRSEQSRKYWRSRATLVEGTDEMWLHDENKNEEPKYARNEANNVRDQDSCFDSYYPSPKANPTVKTCLKILWRQIQWIT